MTAEPRQELERRILVLVATNRDGVLTCEILTRVGIPCTVCPGVEAVLQELERGAGALLLAEENGVGRQANGIAEFIRRQPSWSDFPILMLTRHGADSAAVMHALETLGNVTLLERPIRVNALLSTVRAALRSRARQYDARALLLEREKAAEMLRQSEYRYRTLVEQVQDYAIFMVDPQGRPTSWNEGVKRVLGFDESEFVGEEILPRIFMPEDVEQGLPQRELEEAAVRGTVIGDRWMRRKDGSRFWASGITTALRDRQGTLMGFTKVKRDLTDRKQAEAALQQADRRKDEFLATLAHELRNPLAPICNSLHLLRLSGPSDPALERVYETMERQVNHMVRLVDDLLEVSRITRGQIELKRQRIDLASVVRSAVETSTPIINAAHHQLAISLPAEPIFVDADPVRMAQVIANLLNNAAKYTNEGGQIWLTARQEGMQAVISVRDNGIGIPLEMQPAIFEMFSQLDRSTRHSQGGLGIGLTLVRSLVEMHGGTVQVKSDGEGRGSELIVRLPRSVETPVSGTPGLPVRSSAILPKRRILVVDDNCDAAHSMAMLLRFLGAEVDIANSGPEALSAVERFHPAVVLLDLGMPEMDGYEVAARIRRRPEFDDVVLIALTGWGQEEDRRRSQDAGFDHHLVKPADISSLQALLATGRPEK